MSHDKSATDAFTALLQQRVVIFDGAMGTMIQRHRCSEAQFRGERFKDWRSDLRGNNDLLSLTQPARGCGASGNPGTQRYLPPVLWKLACRPLLPKVRGVLD